MSVRAWQAVGIYLLALIVISSAFWDTPWGKHWVFVSVYILALTVAVVSRLKLTSVMLAALIWLRYNLAEGIDGWQLKVSSAVFAVLLFALVVAVADQNKSQQ